MFPQLFSLGPVELSAYGLFGLLGYGAAAWLIRRLAQAEGLPVAQLTDAWLIAALAGLLGARLLFVLTSWEHYARAPQEIFSPKGGFVFFGGFLFALPSLMAYLRLRGMPLARALDILAPALALAHGIGRLGCFFAGCCHGRYCSYPWGITLSSGLVEPHLRGLPLHPTQLYEAVGLISIAGLLLWQRRKLLRYPGGTGSLYLITYGSLRLLVECFRGDSIRGFVAYTPLSTSQAIALLLLVAGGAWGFRSFRRNQ